MKTTKFRKATMIATLLVASICTTNAATPEKVTYIETDEQNRVAARVVYEQNGTFLTPEYRFEYAYNTSNQISEKTALKWNGTEWKNLYRITVSYTETEACMQYAVWDEKKHQYRPTEKYVYNIDEAGNFLAHYSYKQDKNNSWQLERVLFPVAMLADC